MLSPRAKGTLLIVAAFQIVPFMDAIAKYLTTWYPVSQLVWSRFFFHFVIVAPVVLIRYGGAIFRTPRPSMQIARGAFLLGATLFFFAAVRHIPLADAISLIFVAPILLTAVSPWLLRERVTTRRWLAVATGFAAVVLIVRPGFSGFHWASLLALGAAVMFAAYLLSTRVLSGSAPALVTLAFQSVCGVVLVSAVLPFVWETPTPTHLGLMFAIGAVAALGHFFMIKAFEYTDASYLAPFSYTEIIMHVVLGYALFGDLPDRWTWVGIMLIVATAVYISLPESKRVASRS